VTPPAGALRAKTGITAAGIGLRAFYGALRPMPAMQLGVLIATKSEQGRLPVN